MESLITQIITWTINLVSNLGYAGIFIAMAIEAGGIPLPSEVIMGIAGYLVYKGELNLFLAGLIGALGNATGSTMLYLVGAHGGRPVIYRYGKYFHMDEKRFLLVENWFKQFGEKIIFFLQLLPVVRTFIALPMGILKVDFLKFRIYTFAGSLIWCTLLAYVSYLLGPEWEKLGGYMKSFEVVLGLGLVVIVGIYIIKKIKSRKIED